MTRLHQIWVWLTEPLPILREHDQKRQAWLLSALILIILPIGFVITAIPEMVSPSGTGFLQDPDIQIMFVALIAALLAFRLSRTKYHVLSPIVMVLTATFAIFAAAMPEENHKDYIGLYYLVIPILLASIFFSIRFATLIFGVDLLAIYLLPRIISVYPLDTILVGPFRFVLIMSLLILLASYYRNWLEKDRQTELSKSEARYRALMEQSTEGIVLCDLKTKRVLESNQAYQAMLGYTAKEMLDLTAYDIIADEPTQIDLSVEKLAQHQRLFIGERQHRRKDGSLLDVEVNTHVISYDQRDAMCITVRSITDRKRAETILKESNDRLLIILDGIAADVHVVDMTNYEILFANHHAHESFGRELIGQVCWQAFRGESRPCPHCTNSQLLDAAGKPTGVVVWEGQNPITHKWYLNSSRAIDWIDGRLVRLQIATDITARKQAEEQLQYLAAHDALTGLYNRAFFEEELARLQRSRQFPVSIIMADMNDLKPINDTLGHAAGDEALRRAARIFRQSFRAEDFGARVGGDEFVIVLTKTDAATAERALLRLKSLMADNNVAFPDLPLSFAAGIATGEAGDSLEIVLQNADRKMYQDKQAAV